MGVSTAASNGLKLEAASVSAADNSCGRPRPGSIGSVSNAGGWHLHRRPVLCLLDNPDVVLRVTGAIGLQLVMINHFNFGLVVPLNVIHRIIQLPQDEDRSFILKESS